MTIFARKDLKNGDEVTMEYLDPTLKYLDRERALARYAIHCDCRLCELDRADALYGKRNELLEKFYGLMDAYKADPKKFVAGVRPIVDEVTVCMASSSA